MDPELLNMAGISSASDAAAKWSAADIIGGLLFGGIGFVAFVYGKKMAQAKPLAIGILLMAFPYFAPGTLWLYVIGTALTAALYFIRD